MLEKELAISFPKMDLIVLGLCAIQVICWMKGSHGNAQTIQTAVKTTGYSPQSDIKIPLMKRTPKQLIDHGEV